MNETIWFVEALYRSPAGAWDRRQISANLPRRAAAEAVAAEAERNKLYKLVAVKQGTGRPAKVCAVCCKVIERRNSRPLPCC